MADAARRHPVTFDEYLAAEETADVKHELLDGEVFAMSGALLRHVSITGNVLLHLRTRLRGTRCRAYASDAMVRTPSDDAFYPDVVVTCSDRDQHPRYLEHPSTIVEVLSESTAGYDRGPKFERYRTIPDLREYVVVDPDREAVDVYRRSDEGLWVLHPFRAGDVVHLESLNVTIPIGELYEDVER